MYEVATILEKIDKARRIIRDTFPNQKLSNTIQSINAQLEFIKDDLEKTKSLPTEAMKTDVKRIIIGVQAVREIEPQNEELAELLCDIGYEYKKLCELFIGNTNAL